MTRDDPSMIAAGIPVVHFDAEHSPRGYLYHVLRIWHLPRVLWRHRTLLNSFFLRSLFGRFHGSLLGSFWVLIHPLFLFAVYFVVFGLIMNRWGGDAQSGETAMFAVYLFTGLICFHAIQTGTNVALGSIPSNSNLVRKVAFPCEILPMISIAVETAVFLIGLVVVVVVTQALGLFGGIWTINLGWSTLALPWFVAVMVVMSAGLGMLLANLQVFAPDVRELYSVFSRAWFFVSPNFWMPSFLDDKPEWTRRLVELNPVYPLLIAERQMLGIDTSLGTDPSLGFRHTMWENLIEASIWAVAFLLLGYATFMRNKHRYADLV